MGARYPERPVVGVSGVVLAGGKVLLVKRGRPPGVGLWSLPGGGVELGESLAEACAREIREETGVEAEVGPLVGVFERRLRDGQGRFEYHYVLLDYLCHADPAAQPRAGDDAVQAAWVPLDEIDSYHLTADTAQVIRDAAALAARSA